MKRIEREICGIPTWLMQEYLDEMGGEVIEDGRVVGDGWSATLTEIDPFCLGSIVVGQVLMQLEGEPQAVDQLMVLLEPKLMRAGG